MLPEIQSLRDMQLNIGKRIYKKKIISQQSRQRYESMRKEVFEKYGLQASHLQGIKKVNPKKVYVGGEPMDAIPSDIVLKEDTVIIEDTSLLSELERINSRLKSLIYFMENNKKKTCIGRAHTLLELYKDTLEERRVAKQLIMDTKSRNYQVRTNKMLCLINDLNIKSPKNFYLKGAYSNKASDYMIDLNHLVEFLPKFSLGLAYDLVAEIVQAEKDRIFEGRRLAKLKEIFR